MTALLLIAATWMFALASVVGLCVAARLGDREAQPEARARATSTREPRSQTPAPPRTRTAPSERVAA